MSLSPPNLQTPESLLNSDSLLPAHQVAAIKYLASTARMPDDQIGRFLSSFYAPLPWAMAFHAAAREADRPDGPTQIGTGGARGPGKSHAVMAQVGLDDCQRFEGLKFLFLRRVQKSAAESFDDLVRKVFAGVECEAIANRVTFKNGSRILIGGYNNERDIDKYLGIEYDGIVLEEETQISNEKREKIRGSLRTSRSDWRPRWYGSTNPGGIGHNAFKERFVIPYREGKETDTRFFPSTYRDNPFLNPEYINYLLSLTGPLGRAWRDGDWDIFEGQAFSAFSYETHVVKPFDLPKHWMKWRSVDWGYRNPFCCVWLTKDPDMGRVYVYREVYTAGLTDRQQARAILDLTPPDEKISLTYADPSMWIRKSHQETTYTSADEYLAEGVALTRADNDRLTRKRKTDTLLALLPDGRPGLIFFSVCTDCIRTIPALPYSMRNPEDVDSDAEDHAYDAMSYGLTSIKARPSQKQTVITVVDPLASKVSLRSGSTYTKDM